MTPGETIRACRKELRLSLRTLATQVELSPTALSNIERDRYRCGVNTAHRIFTALDLTFDQRERIVQEWAADVFHHAEQWTGIIEGSCP